MGDALLCRGANLPGFSAVVTGKGANSMSAGGFLRFTPGAPDFDGWTVVDYGSEFVF
ncbi:MULTISPECIES: hypothetical protein [unclassified Methanoculleus]|jgi:hypothetical protein|uniref:Uncharacterized protein n=1 Tax=Methanoculleus palmolei TaxID=72612 RepID=A0ABD8A8K0_9EURY|nr:hypothetical protein [Methanoculleus sp. UBA377]WOX55851.1 hypothetical protein R6Y95_00600 [Methanoculleus palmolei]